ncbi:MULTISPECIES: DUF6655 family protein [unclassified Brevundimonas]|uniref:DUF6655 family protein n=1 Tax=unclassified Brevundimonas TaxID=2622653 RepID=UPI0025C50B0A|nr:MULTISPECIES: DUF6655 family protein [unclassified Brevundimonas]
MVAVRTSIAAALVLALGACASVTETNPSRTATDMLLVNRAAERAVEGLILPVPQGARIFVDETYFQAENARYALSAIRAALSEAGYALVRERGESDAVFEVRATALSLEQMRRVFGLPEMRVPINENFNVVSLPELSIYSNRDRMGVAEFSGFIYDTRTGMPLGAVTPMIGQYKIRSHRALMVLTWGQQLAQPGEREPGSSWREF